MRVIEALIAVSVLALAGSVPGVSGAPAEPEPAVRSSLSMSPDLLDLYRAEMRQLLIGTQAIALALPTGDWDNIIATSRQMEESYVLERELTQAQLAEIAGLPESFQEMDRGFHARTGRLAAAAADRDPEAVAFQFARLLETCTGCHATFAQARFPTLRPEPAQAPHHSHEGEH